MFVGVLGQAGTWGVYRYNLLKGQLGVMVIENPHFDIINPNNNPGSVGLLYSRAEHRLVGIRYMTDWLHTIWLDPGFVAVQEAVDRVLPQTNNLLTSWSDDRSKFLVLAVTERSPGTYYLFDAAKHRFTKLGDRAPWIKPEELAEVFSITFNARDGLKLHGYLTYPPGKARKGLPLVVFPHGGPFARDTMDYDSVLQFLATRGYAVLQVNYRGSPGFGQAYYLAGWHEVGKKIQDDITDGVKALITGGVADPKRIAIFGGSYGGYSALWGLENTPELYRCGISLAGVTDWVALLGRATQKVRFGEHLAGTEYAHNYWKEKIGDPATDEASLKAISPLYHVDRIQAPVLIVQGTEDRNVPDSQAKDLVAALDARHANYDAWFVKGEGHSYFHEKEREELFNRIDAFLAKNMQ
ncbi:MAG: alpha/beta hydrolase family protein [Opitutales bacterium]